MARDNNTAAKQKTNRSNMTMIKKTKPWRDKLTITALLTASLFAGAVLAAEISQTPLFLNKTARPNILFILDDSVSMDFEVYTKDHYPGWSYDADFNRSWARGGKLSDENYLTRQAKHNISNSFVSYPGACIDLNADGVCYTSYDINGDELISSVKEIDFTAPLTLKLARLDEDEDEDDNDKIWTDITTAGQFMDGDGALKITKAYRHPPQTTLSETGIWGAYTPFPYTVDASFSEQDDQGNQQVNYFYLYETGDSLRKNPRGPFRKTTDPSPEPHEYRYACTGGPGYANVGRRIYYSFHADSEYTSAYSCSNLAGSHHAAFKGAQQGLIPEATTQVWSNQSVRKFTDIKWKKVEEEEEEPTPASTKHVINKFDPWPLAVDWRPRSAAFNILYYNPETQYDPWAGIVAPKANIESVFSNPQSGTAGHRQAFVNFNTKALMNTLNLYKPQGVDSGFVYEIWEDDAGYWGTHRRLRRFHVDPHGNWMGSKGGTGVTDPATGRKVVDSDSLCSKYADQRNGEVDLWDTHYRVEVHKDKTIVRKVRRTPHIFGERSEVGGPEIHCLSDTRVSEESKRKIDGTGFEPALADGDCIRFLGKGPTGECRTADEVRTNIANWFQYSRRGRFVMKGAIAKITEELPGANYGIITTSKAGAAPDLFVAVSEGDSSGEEKDRHGSLRGKIHNFVLRKHSTHLRSALQKAGEYFKDGLKDKNGVKISSPITESCQKNLAVLMTDGAWGGPTPTGVGDQDGDMVSDTLADVAMRYYNEDLRQDLDNNVPIQRGGDENRKQHLNTITVAFGLEGGLTADAFSGDWPSEDRGGGSISESANWGNPVSGAGKNKSKIDDLWHAAYNSKGSYLNANSQQELIDKLSKTIAKISETVPGSASAVSVSSSLLTDTTNLYQTTFHSKYWDGDVTAYALDSVSGRLIGDPLWSAAKKLRSRSADRKIFTLGAGSGKPFRWSSLVGASEGVPDQKRALQKIWTGTASGVESFGDESFGMAQLNYIRGNTDSRLRDRGTDEDGVEHKLGDIVHSKAAYVAPPSRPYPDSWSEEGQEKYSKFVADNTDREPVVYVGANDGMLHAFDAGTGDELYAYIPRLLIPNLNSLTSKDAFEHRYFVDSTPVTGDVLFGENWHTVLVGGLGGGGKGIYALDITEVPGEDDGEGAIATAKAMWEFSNLSDGGGDMGYSFSRPAIARLESGKWAAIFGNGYDSTDNKAVLYVLEFEDDSSKYTVRPFDTGFGGATNKNGMSTPTVIDIDGDLTADRVYAGDLLGNVWSIDITSNTEAPKLIFETETGQPITTKIIVEEHPLGKAAGYLLHFGTGTFFRSGDNVLSGPTTQSIYSVWDYGGTVTVDRLLKQEILEQVQPAGAPELRVTSTKPIKWLADGVQVGDLDWQAGVVHKGWYLDLKNPDDNNYGERVINEAVLLGDSIIYSTLLPSSEACAAGGGGWLMSLNSATGGRLENSPFDINEDGRFNSDDFAKWEDGNGIETTAVASGVKTGSGIPSAPALITRKDGTTVGINDRSSGDIVEGDINSSSGFGRQSWVELY